MAALSPSFEPAFRNLNLNQRVDANARFIPDWLWNDNAEPFDVDELEGQRCYGGLDLSSTRDLTALALWFPDAGKLLVWRWVPAHTVKKRAERDRVPYPLWTDAGLIEATPGRATDRIAIARRLADIRGRYDVRQIAFDRWRFEDLAKLPSDEGIELPLVPFVPGWKSDAPAVDAFERAMLDRRMRHNGSPILRWQAGNVIIEPDPAGNRKPDKAKSIDRIDGIVSAIMACDVASTDEGPQVYKPASRLRYLEAGNCGWMTSQSRWTDGVSDAEDCRPFGAAQRCLYPDAGSRRFRRHDGVRRSQG